VRAAGASEAARYPEGPIHTARRLASVTVDLVLLGAGLFIPNDVVSLGGYGVKATAGGFTAFRGGWLVRRNGIRYLSRFFADRGR